MGGWGWVQRELSLETVGLAPLPQPREPESMACVPWNLGGEVTRDKSEGR